MIYYFVFGLRCRTAFLIFVEGGKSFTALGAAKGGGLLVVVTKFFQTVNETVSAQSHDERSLSTKKMKKKNQSPTLRVLSGKK